MWGKQCRGRFERHSLSCRGTTTYIPHRSPRRLSRFAHIALDGAVCKTTKCDAHPYRKSAHRLTSLAELGSEPTVADTDVDNQWNRKFCSMLHFMADDANERILLLRREFEHQFIMNL